MLKCRARRNRRELAHVILDFDNFQAQNIEIRTRNDGPGSSGAARASIPRPTSPAPRRPARARERRTPAEPTNPSKATTSPTTFTSNPAKPSPELRLHYRTLGTPARDATGRVTNAVLILQAPAAERNFLSPQFAGVL